MTETSFSLAGALNWTIGAAFCIICSGKIWYLYVPQAEAGHSARFLQFGPGLHRLSESHEVHVGALIQEQHGSALPHYLTLEFLFEGEGNSCIVYRSSQAFPDYLFTVGVERHDLERDAVAPGEHWDCRSTCSSGLVEYLVYQVGEGNLQDFVNYYLP